LAHEGLGSVVVALAVELTRTDQRVPCLIVLGHGLAQQTPAPAKQQDRKKTRTGKNPCNSRADHSANQNLAVAMRFW
jgi:hypothetical protein